MTKNTEKQKLVESLGIDIEERLKLSPLASRIYALLILSSYDGLSFEAIRAFIGASKSSTSVNISVLTQLNYIDFYTKSGDRKRYFKLSKFSQRTTLIAYLSTIEKEKIMMKKINDFNHKYHPEKFIDEDSLGKIYETYLFEKEVLVKKTIEKYEAFRDKNSTI